MKQHLVILGKRGIDSKAVRRLDLLGSFCTRHFSAQNSASSTNPKRKHDKLAFIFSYVSAM